ncbi:TolC family protein [Polynucleobacter paneuropaeus]|nr:TolC family protein [Polynucleobacter paneuropaeus]
MHCIRHASFALVGILFFSPIQAIELKFSDISLNQYLDLVRQNNADIGIAALEIKTAEAQKVADSLYRLEPSLGYYRGGYSNQLPYSTYNTPVSTTYSLNFNVEGWGKRDAREDMAQAKIGAGNVQLEKKRSNVEQLAIYGYIDTLKFNLLRKTYSNALYKVKSLPSSAKTITAENLLKNNQVIVEEALVIFSQSLRNYSGDAIKAMPLPTGNLNYPVQNLNLDALIADGQSQSIEILELKSLIELADKNITLTNANRNIDVRPYISQTRIPAYQYSNGVTNYNVTTPYGSGTVTGGSANYSAQNMITAGVTIPIPITNYLQSADIVSAANKKLEYEMKLRDLKVQIEVGITQAFIEYGRAKANLQAEQRAYDLTLASHDKNQLTAIMDLRDREGALLLSKAEHLKSLVKLWRKCGNYSAPNM